MKMSCPPSQGHTNTNRIGAENEQAARNILDDLRSVYLIRNHRGMHSISWVKRGIAVKVYSHYKCEVINAEHLFQITLATGV